MSTMRFMLITGPEVAAAVIVAGLLDVFANFSFITNHLELAAASEFAHERSLNAFSAVLQKLDAIPYTPNIVVFLVWFIVGLFVLSLLYSFVQFTHEFKDEFEESTVLVHPRTFSQRRFWLSVLGDYVIRFATICGMVLSALFIIRVMLPLNTAAIQVYALDHADLVALAVAIASFVLLAVSLLLLTAFAKIFVRALRYKL